MTLPIHKTKVRNSTQALHKISAENGWRTCKPPTAFSSRGGCASEQSISDSASGQLQGKSQRSCLLQYLPQSLLGSKGRTCSTPTKWLLQHLLSIRHSYQPLSPSSWNSRNLPFTTCLQCMAWKRGVRGQAVEVTIEKYPKQRHARFPNAREYQWAWTVCSQCDNLIAETETHRVTLEQKLY